MTTHVRRLVLLLLPVLVLAAAGKGAAQVPDATRTPDATRAPDAAEMPAAGEDDQSKTAPPAVAAAQEEDDDLSIDPAQPDFTIVTLPTTLRLPRFKSAFRVTHRFARPLGQGDFGDLLEDFFGFDAGALIGLEYRFGIWHGTQIGIHRTSDKTIQLFAQYNILRESRGSPVGLDALATTEGTNNLRDSYSPALGVIVSRSLGRHGSVYVQPIWVNNTNPLPSELADDNDTFFVGLGARVRVRPTIYLVGEVLPRVAGFKGSVRTVQGLDDGVSHATFGIEKRVGGHSFQINFSNSFGTTLGQLARGGQTNDDWYIGFNISRKFF